MADLPGIIMNYAYPIFLLLETMDKIHEVTAKQLERSLLDYREYLNNKDAKIHSHIDNVNYVYTALLTYLGKHAYDGSMHSFTHGFRLLLPIMESLGFGMYDKIKDLQDEILHKIDRLAGINSQYYVEIMEEILELLNRRIVDFAERTK